VFFQGAVGSPGAPGTTGAPGPVVCTITVANYIILQGYVLCGPIFKM